MKNFVSVVIIGLMCSFSTGALANEDTKGEPISDVSHEVENMELAKQVGIGTTVLAPALFLAPLSGGLPVAFWLGTIPAAYAIAWYGDSVMHKRGTVLTTAFGTILGQTAGAALGFVLGGAVALAGIASSNFISSNVDGDVSAASSTLMLGGLATGAFIQVATTIVGGGVGGMAAYQFTADEAGESDPGGLPGLFEPAHRD